MGVRSDHGYLSVTFQHRGKRQVEYLNLKDTPSNRRTARKISEQIKAEILLKQFNYASRFPNSKYAEKRAAMRELTLGKFAQQWLDEIAPRLTPETAYDYQSMIDTHILPHDIAKMLLSAIDDGHVANFVSDLRAKLVRGRGLSPRRINMVIARLRTIFVVANRRRDDDGHTLVIANPMEFISNERQAKTEVNPFELTEVKRLLNTAGEGQFRNLLTTLIFTGMRPNEAIGLQKDDVDFERGVIHIRRTAVRKGKTRLPKTVGSERQIEMADMVVAALTAQFALRGFEAGAPGDAPIFANEIGGMLMLANVREREWAPLLELAKLDARPIYQCRHTFARLMLEAGDTPQHIASMLGHTSTDMIFRVYGRWSKMDATPALGRLNDQFKETRLLKAVGEE